MIIFLFSFVYLLVSSSLCFLLIIISLLFCVCCFAVGATQKVLRKYTTFFLYVYGGYITFVCKTDEGNTLRVWMRCVHFSYTSDTESVTETTFAMSQYRDMKISTIEYHH